jgi:cell division protein FtsB
LRELLYFIRALKDRKRTPAVGANITFRACTFVESLVPSPSPMKPSASETLRRFPSPLPAPRRQQQWTGKLLCFSACVLAVNGLIGERGLSETLRARREFQSAVAELSRVQYENAALAETVRQLQQDASSIENVARAELGLIKPGEILVVVKSPAAATRTTPAASASAPSLTKTAVREARP